MTDIRDRVVRLPDEVFIRLWREAKQQAVYDARVNGWSRFGINRRRLFVDALLAAAESEQVTV